MLNVEWNSGQCQYQLSIKIQELRPGCHLHATVYLEISELGNLECMVFVPYSIAVTEATGSEFSGCLGVSAKYGGPTLRYGAVWNEGWNKRNVFSLGMLVGTARNLSHHRRYSPWISSLRWVIFWEGRVDSDSLKCCSILHELDHHENLDLVAMPFWAITAFVMRG